MTTVLGEARTAGFVSAHARPLRIRGKVIGAINLFHSENRQLDATDVRLCQAMADIATIGIVQERAISEAAVLAYQLQRALNSRIVLEQAKGRLAERLGVDLDDAFAMLRRYARQHNRGLTEVAGAFHSNDLGAGDLSPEPAAVITPVQGTGP